MNLVKESYLQVIDTITKQVFAEVKIDKKLQLIRHKVIRDADTDLLLTASKQKAKELWTKSLIVYKTIQYLPREE